MCRCKILALLCLAYSTIWACCRWTSVKPYHRKESPRCVRITCTKCMDRNGLEDLRALDISKGLKLLDMLKLSFCWRYIHGISWSWFNNLHRILSPNSHFCSPDGLDMSSKPLRCRPRHQMNLPHLSWWSGHRTVLEKQTWLNIAPVSKYRWVGCLSLPFEFKIPFYLLYPFVWQHHLSFFYSQQLLSKNDSWQTYRYIQIFPAKVWNLLREFILVSSEHDHIV